jgi:hypothetical protein
MSNKRVKLPKRVAGVKIPKAIRKGPIATFLNSSGGQVLVAEALIAFGAAYAARRVNPDAPIRDVLRHPINSVRTRIAANGGNARSERFGRAVRAGLNAFRDEWQGPQFLGDSAEALDGEIETTPDDEVMSPKKPASSRGDPLQPEAREGASHPH